MLDLLYGVSLVVSYLPIALILGLPTWVIYSLTKNVLISMLGLNIGLVAGAWMAPTAMGLPLIILILLADIGVVYFKLKERGIV
jgi:uncharacterized membrane protein